MKPPFFYLLRRGTSGARDERVTTETLSFCRKRERYRLMHVLSVNWPVRYSSKGLVSIEEIVKGIKIIPNK